MAVLRTITRVTYHDGVTDKCNCPQETVLRVFCRKIANLLKMFHIGYGTKHSIFATLLYFRFNPLNVKDQLRSIISVKLRL